MEGEVDEQGGDVARGAQAQGGGRDGFAAFAARPPAGVHGVKAVQAGRRTSCARGADAHPSGSGDSPPEGERLGVHQDELQHRDHQRGSPSHHRNSPFFFVSAVSAGHGKLCCRCAFEFIRPYLDVAREAEIASVQDL
eukprot:6200159-Pleurochrysis_carterae.AAC.1